MHGPHRSPLIPKSVPDIPSMRTLEPHCLRETVAELSPCHRQESRIPPNPGRRFGRIEKPGPLALCPGSVLTLVSTRQEGAGAGIPLSKIGPQPLATGAPAACPRATNTPGFQSLCLELQTIVEVPLVVGCCICEPQCRLDFSPRDTVPIEESGTNGPCLRAPLRRPSGPVGRSRHVIAPPSVPLRPFPSVPPSLGRRRDRRDTRDRNPAARRSRFMWVSAPFLIRCPCPFTPVRPRKTGGTSRFLHRRFSPHSERNHRFSLGFFRTEVFFFPGRHLPPIRRQEG